MARYQADEFLGTAKQPFCFELAVEVDKKIDLMYDMYILYRKKSDDADELEAATRQMLLG